MKATIASNRKEKDMVLLLTHWFQQNQRSLPWRLNQDPYRIWISEVMLQQTTVQAVIPYFEKFVTRFPDVVSLASAQLAEVFQLWAGLGYYSRARNLHLAAKQFQRTGFPTTYQELLQYPGLGPYTSRAVASIAFEERVGVIDGNVIRVLSRFLGLKKSWWLPRVRDEYQALADAMVKVAKPSEVNQALMELGATICTPQKPLCLLCPWKSACVAHSQDLIETLPLKRPRKKTEIWIWQPKIMLQNAQVGLVVNDYAPFLKKQMIFPGNIYLSKTKPKVFKAKHSITHHQIYIQPIISKAPAPSAKVFQQIKWVALPDLEQVNPSILLRKALAK